MCRTRGWSISGEDEGKVFLCHEGKDVKILINTARNSLQFEARIFGIALEEHKTKEREEK